MFDCFGLSASKLSSDMSLSGLSFHEKGILLSCLVFLWDNICHGVDSVSTKELCQQIGCKEEELNMILSRIDKEWISEEFDLDTLDLNVCSTYLRKEKERIDLEIIELNKETEREKKNRLVAQASLRAVMEDQEKEDEISPIAYLKAEDRSTHVYHGWLPTNRFNKGGQVYYVSDDLIQELKKEFPFCDVNKAILEIHTWLSKNVTKRKTAARIPDFIRYWLSNTNQNKNPQNAAINFDAIERQLEKVIG